MKWLALLVLVGMFTPVQAQITYTNVYDSVNSERVGHNLPTLRHSSVLDKVAQDRLNDMVSKNYFAHTSPTGQDEWTWYKKEKYDFKEAGENLAIGFGSVKDNIKGWMDSKTHRENILSPKYTETGIATDGNIVVQEFGQTRAEYFTSKNHSLLTQLFPPVRK